MALSLVSLQFGLIAFLLWPSAQLVLSVNTAVAAVGLALGFALFGWSFMHLPRASFTIMPTPTVSNILCESGPYRYIRHPMYTGVLICAVCAALAYSQTWKWLSVLALVVVLWIKLKFEENLLIEKHAAYAGYIARTKALLPFIV